MHDRMARTRLARHRDRARTVQDPRRLRRQGRRGAPIPERQARHARRQGPRGRAGSSAYFENDRWLTADQGGGKRDARRDRAGLGRRLRRCSRSRRRSAAGATLLVQPQDRADRPRATTKRDQHRDRRAPSPTTARSAGGARAVPPAHPDRRACRRTTSRVVVDSVVGQRADRSRRALPIRRREREPPSRYLKTPGRARCRSATAGATCGCTASVDGGAPADFIFDTGASVTVIDSAYAARHGLATEGEACRPGRGRHRRRARSRSSSRCGSTAPTATASRSRDQKVARALDQPLPRAVLLARLRRRARLRLHLALRDRDRLRPRDAHAPRSRRRFQYAGDGDGDPVHARRHHAGGQA